MNAAGYVRVSTDEQSPEMQREALARYATARGWRLKMYEDFGVSGADPQRLLFRTLMHDVQLGGRVDVVLVWKFDRLSRSVAELLDCLQTFQRCRVEFVSVTEGIDTGTPAGRMVYTMIAAIAEFERALIRERVRAGVRAKRARTGRWGRPRTMSPDQARQATELRAKGRPLREVARTLGVPRTTLRRALGPAAS